MHLLETQRTAFLAALAANPDAPGLSNPELLALYLASLGYALPSLLDSLQAWAVDNSIQQTLALTTIGV